MIYDSEDYTEDEKRNLAFQTTVAYREALSIAKRSQSQVTYEDVFDIIYDFGEDLYNDITELLLKKNKSEEVELAIARATAQSTEGKVVTPQEILDEDLLRIEKDFAKNNKSAALKRKRAKIKAAIKYFEPRTPSEHAMLNQDFFLAKRQHVINNQIYKNEKRVDYKLSDDRILRIRLFHPDSNEHITGSDLVYEQYDLEGGRVRFVHLQYKVWDEKDVLYFSKGNLTKQIDKLSNNICESGYCLSKVGKNHSTGFRLPYCASFLRPTDRKQSEDSSLITNGIHCPICRIQKIKETQKSIKKNEIRDLSIGHTIFEEMFIYNMLGSRWVDIDKLEEFYDSIGVDNEMDSIRVHVQEVYVEPEYKEQVKQGR